VSAGQGARNVDEVVAHYKKTNAEAAEKIVKKQAEKEK
jgi:hypothetical protein